jgi:hypothetical protein
MPRQRLYPDDETLAFSIRLPAALKREIEQRAQQNRRSLNQEIVFLIQQALGPKAPGSKGGRSGH